MESDWMNYPLARVQTLCRWIDKWIAQRTRSRLIAMAEAPSEAPTWVYSKDALCPFPIYLSQIRYQENGIGIYIQPPAGRSHGVFSGIREDSSMPRISSTRAVNM